MRGKEGYARKTATTGLTSGCRFTSPLPKSAQKIPWKFCEIATIQMTDLVIKCK